MNLEVKIDHAKCVASGSCTMLAPERFEAGPDGKALARPDGDPAAEAKLTGLTEAESNQVREAAMFCPPEAISVWDADSGEQYYP
jgi:ferredoxin